MFETRLIPDGNDFRVTGRKFYSTGALFADIIPVAATGEDGKIYLVFADPQAPGLTITDDWSGFAAKLDAIAAMADAYGIVPAMQRGPTG